MNDMNNGYSGYSMSNRAVAAYESGEKPLSKWRKSDIINELDDAGVDTSILKKYSAHTLKKYFLVMSSWHHTSGYLNETDFYKVKSREIHAEDLDRIEENFKKSKAAKKEDPDIEKAKIRYGVWEGTRKHPKLVEEEAYALIKGDWAYLEDGTRKKLSGKHIEIKERYSRAPRGTADIFKKIKKNLGGK